MAIIAQSIVVLVLALAQLIIGISAGVGFGPLIADISHWFVRRRGIAVAQVASGNYLSGGIWPLILAGVLEDHRWRTA